MRAIAIDDPGVCQSLCHAASQSSPRDQTAERMDVLFDDTLFSTKNSLDLTTKFQT